ncbi:AAA family ATPase [Oceanirhabdus sp. W0125-5]|uniref:AAA family ATPase n=1 Tax=Oceanirhabdus sp. W0125-5 TaxID=2999116 RepID=UPI0022F2A682|nr:AAA family ATPase [Oceanirhabdus sp. W0125-5]WBW96282.1 AAA family ATPase [Oceanirhabdus sp. W0125-5]
MKKKIPIGIGDFKELIEGDFYFVDKSLLIKDVIDDGAKVILLPRPRRFGKTLSMSMLEYFFQKSENDNSHLFKGLKVVEHKGIMEKQGKYPVIFITFKDVKYSSWEECYDGLRVLVSKLFQRYKFILEDSKLSNYHKNEFLKIIDMRANIVELSNALATLSEILCEVYEEKTVILIDEYDVPIQSGFSNNYYKKIMEFIRNFLSAGLKDNTYLQKAVLTGILRVSKESVFSGLNNLKVCTILNPQYSRYFGFSHEEIEELLKYYDVEDKINDVKDWYNGYKFGKSLVYNPWSILNYIDNSEMGFMPHWVNTSSNNIVKELLAKGGEGVKKDLEELIKGNSITKKIDENIVMGDIHRDSESVWNFLFFTGYLKLVERELRMGRNICELKIPNKEVQYLFEDIIISWFNENISNDKYNIMLNSLVNGDIKTFSIILREYVLSSVSYFDTGKNESEKFYHAFVLGLLISLSKEYQVKSNRESGYGRYDIMIIPKDKSKLGIIIEFKKVDEYDKETLEIAVNEALKQIEEKNYKQELLDLGIENIMELGIAFEGKEVLVKKGTE